MNGHEVRRLRAVVTVEGSALTIRGLEVRDTLRRNRLRPIFVGTTGGWMLDRGRLGDAVAALERAGYELRFEGEHVAIPPVVSPVTPTAPVHAATEEWLW